MTVGSWWNRSSLRPNWRKNARNVTR